MAEQNVPQWYSASTLNTADVTYHPVEPAQRLSTDPVAIVAIGDYETEILAGAGRIEVLSYDDGEVPNEYWFDNIDTFQISTEEDVDQAIAEEVDRIKAFIAKLERVGPTDYGRSVIDDLTESISDGNIKEAKESLMSYIEDEEDTEDIDYTVCNGTLNRLSGMVDHTDSCPVHGPAIAF